MKCQYQIAEKSINAKIANSKPEVCLQNQINIRKS